MEKLLTAIWAVIGIYACAIVGFLWLLVYLCRHLQWVN
jgi:hypothetical protein